VAAGTESQTRTYRVDGEVGRFEFETYRVARDGAVVVDTGDLFPPLTGQEWYRTVGFKEIGFVHGTINGSFRKTATWFNRVRHQQMLQNPVPYEAPADSIQVSIDPVGVKKQKESRDGQAKEQKREMVYQTVAHLHHQNQSYTLTGQGVKTVLPVVLAFLLHNGLLKYNLLFFVDGQRSLNNSILALFAWFGPV
jgi:hypothetical protein